MKQLNSIIVNAIVFLCIMETGIHAQTRTQTTADKITAVRQLSGNIINLSFDLYRGIGRTSGNCFFSPYSISMGLSMLWYGARGTTADEIARVMHTTFTGDELRTAYMSTAKVFDDSRDVFLQDTENKSVKALRLLVANGYWVQKAYSLRKEYTDIVRNTFGAEVKNLDFITAAEESRRTINTWISDRTERMIENIIPQGAITPATRLVLANTVYFEAKWYLPFVSIATVDGAFHLFDGSTVSVPMMHQPSWVRRYTDTSDWQAAELPYRDNSMVMLIIMPRPGRFEAVERSLSAEMLSSIDDSLRGVQLKITFPKFKFTSPSLSLKRVLSDLGMKTAFVGEADFSGITSNRKLFLADVFHKASVTVNEEGTVAAASTVEEMLGGIPIPGMAFTVDRPFIFIIRDLKTRMVLFMGRMVDPSK